jgi:hypothetical protein
LSDLVLGDIDWKGEATKQRQMIQQLVNKRIADALTATDLTDKAAEGVKNAAALTTHELDEQPLLTKSIEAHVHRWGVLATVRGGEGPRRQ